MAWLTLDYLHHAVFYVLLCFCFLVQCRRDAGNPFLAEQGPDGTLFSSTSRTVAEISALARRLDAGSRCTSLGVVEEWSGDTWGGGIERVSERLGFGTNTLRLQPTSNQPQTCNELLSFSMICRQLWTW